MIARLMVQLPPNLRCLVVASFDKILYDNYLCWVESNKQQIDEVRSKIQVENSMQEQLLFESRFVLCLYSFRHSAVVATSLSRDKVTEGNRTLHQPALPVCSLDYSLVQWFSNWGLHSFRQYC